MMKGLINEFKEFAFKGSVFDMAIGVIVGGAIGPVVSAVVEMLMGIIGAFTGGTDSLSALAFTIGKVNVAYGPVLKALVDFLILMLCVFFIVKAVNKGRDAFAKKEEEKPEEPAPKPDDVVLLEEIRDLLKKQA